MCALFTGSQTFKLKYLEITKNTFMHFYQSTHALFHPEFLAPQIQKWPPRWPPQTAAARNAPVRDTQTYRF